MSYASFRRNVCNKIDLLNFNSLEADCILQEEAHIAWKGNSKTAHEKRHKAKNKLRGELRSMLTDKGLKATL